MAEKVNKEKFLGSNYAELYRLEQTGDYERALKITNKILHAYPDEAVAFQCKVVCFIQQSRFDEALTIMKRSPSLSKGLHFERAYILYRTQRSIEALQEIEAAPELDFRLLELRAQVYYRLERFYEAFQQYQEITSSVDDDYQNERETNKGAALTYAGPEIIKKFLPQIKDDTYEVCFNKACQLIALGQYTEAEKKLRQCEKLCRDALEEDGASEEEIQLELAHARIQLGYVYQKQGRIKEAQTLYLNVLKLKLEDIALNAVACNNAVVINKDQNVFDSKKKMKVATNEQLVHKLLQSQKKYITLNNALLNFYTNQMDVCRKLLSVIDETWPDLKPTTTVIRTMILMKNNDYLKALTLLLETATSVKLHEDKLYLALCQAHIWLMQGDRQKACDILQDLGDDRYRPGIVGALITLYLAEGKEEIAQKFYKETVEWYKVNKKGEGDLTNLWRQAAEFHIRNGQAAVAADSLEELLRATPDDMKTIGQLVVAYAEFDHLKAIQLGHDLFSMEEIAAELDIENVESSVWLSTKKVPAPLTTSPGSTSSLLENGNNGRRKKKHHKKKGKLPKSYDPTIPPDPERWLPKYERTGYRKKRDRRVKEIIKGSQGTASGQAELFDFSSRSANDSETAQDSPSSVDPSPAPNRSQKGKSQQKKKNRRR